MLSLEIFNARWSALRDTARTKELVADCEQRAARAVWIEPGSEEHHLRPCWQQMRGRAERRQLETAEGEAQMLSLDDNDRVTIVHGKHSREYITWSRDWAERVRIGRSGRATELEIAALDGCGRPTDGLLRRPGDGNHVRDERFLCRYDADARPAVVLSHHDGHVNASCFTYDASGRLLFVERVVLAGEHHGDIDGIWASAMVALEQPVRRSVVWDAVLMRREDALPAPSEALVGIAVPLADVIVREVEAVRSREAIGTLAFITVAVHPSARLDKPSLVTVGAADTSYRDRSREVADDGETLLPTVLDGAPGTATVDVIATCPPDLLQRIRAGLQAIATVAGETSPDELAEQAGAQLAAELAVALAHREWDDTDPAFLPLVTARPDREIEEQLQHERAADQEVEGGDDPHGGWAEKEDRGLDGGREPDEHQGLERFPTMRATVGHARVDAFLASLRSSDSGLRWSPADHRPAGRPALVALLIEAGVPDAQAAHVASHAAWGIVLEPGGYGTTRIGGVPTLSRASAWPTASGRLLSHVATIDLSELPPVEGREALPAHGVLSFFADLTEAGALAEPVSLDTPGQQAAAVVHTLAGEPTYEPQPPDSAEQAPPVRLDERRVRPTARLQVPTGGFGSADPRCAVDRVSDYIIERLTPAINGATPHQLLGFPSMAQDDPRGSGEVVALHIGNDPALGFDFLDAGSLTFIGESEDVQTGRWNRLTVWPSSS